MNSNEQFVLAMHEAWKVFYAEDLRRRTKLGLHERARRMALVCKKKHTHFSRCEVTTHGK